jgi:small-conductance mechanosensitive channel
MNRALPFLLFLLIAWNPCPASATDHGAAAGAPGAPPQKAPGAEPAGDRKQDAGRPTDLPGIADVVPRAAELDNQVAEVDARIAALREVSLAADFKETAENQSRELRGRLAQLGDPDNWTFDQILEYRRVALLERQQLERTLEFISTGLAELENLRRDWEERLTHWKAWRESHHKEQSDYPRETFDRALKTIARVLEDIQATVVRRVELQQALNLLLHDNLQLRHQLDGGLARVREETFKQNGPMLFAPELFDEVNAGMWAAAMASVKQALRVDLAPTGSGRWGIGLATVACLVLGAVLRRLGPAIGANEALQPIIVHPWAAATFITIIITSAHLKDLAPWLRPLLWLVITLAGSVMLYARLDQRRQRLAFALLMGTATVSLSLQILALPAPLYRLYHVIIIFLGTPLLLWLAGRERQTASGRLSRFAAALQVAIVVFAVCGIAQFFGYSTLAGAVFHSFLKVSMVATCAAVTLPLGNGVIHLLLHLPALTRLRFFRLFGAELEARVRVIFSVLVWLATSLQILHVLGMYDSWGQAWKEILGIAVSVGTLRVSLGMVVLSAALLYLAHSFSWFLRSFLEAEIFPRRSLDRGVRDAIKKLAHYCIVFLGVLTAISVTGFDLTSFALLGGALGIGIGFGLQNVINNFVSGLILLFERPVKVGDTVVIENQTGKVKKIGLRSTVIETFDLAEVIVPNSNFVSTTVTNWTLTTRRARIKIPVGVAYGSDVPQVLGMLKEIAAAHPMALPDPPANVLFMAFGASSLDFEVHVWIANVADLPTVRSEIGLEIERRFREAGVEIPFPQQTLHVRSVDEVVLGRLGKGEECALRPIRKATSRNEGS